MWTKPVNVLKSFDSMYGRLYGCTCFYKHMLLAKEGILSLTAGFSYQKIHNLDQSILSE